MLAAPLNSARTLPDHATFALTRQDDSVCQLVQLRDNWLADAHRILNEAVFAYGWPPDLSTPEILTRLLALNQPRQSTRSKSCSPLLCGSHAAPA